MELNKVYLEDCRETLKRSDIKFDYVFTSPPDFHELDMDVDNGLEEYYSFINEVVDLLIDKCDLITISMTDRKHGGKIEPKVSKIVQIFLSKGYSVKTYKIWCKDVEPKVSLYRQGFSHVVTFFRDGTKVKNNMYKPFKPDVYFVKNEKYKGYSFGLPEEIAEIHILNYTSEGDVVFDPFMGSGTIGVAAKMNGRKYIGSEIYSKYHELAEERLKDKKE